MKTIQPSGCQMCGELERFHGAVIDTRGLHYFMEPDQSTIKLRMRIRALAKRA